MILTPKTAQGILADGICSSAMNAFCAGPFLTAFALALGATHWEIGVIAAIPFASLLMQFVGLYVVNRWKKRRALVLASAFCARIFWIPIILLPFYQHPASLSLFLFVLLVSGLVGALPGPAWNSLLRSLIPPETIGHVMSSRLAWGTGVALVLTITGGFFIDAWPKWSSYPPLEGYSWLFAVGIAFGLAGVFFISRLPEPRMAEEDASSLIKLLRAPLRDANFRPVLGFIAFWNLTIAMATPFFVVYMIERLGLSLKTVTALTVVQQAAYAFSARIWGRLSDRYSSKAVLATALPLMLAALVGWSFTTLPERYILTIPILVLIHLTTGFSLSAIRLSISHLSLKRSPAAMAHGYMAMASLVEAPGGIIAPILGGWLADFFSARHFALILQWQGPSRGYSVHVLSVRALDFVFLIAAVIGVLTLEWLAFIREETDGSKNKLLHEFQRELVSPFRRATPGGVALQ